MVLQHIALGFGVILLVAGLAGFMPAALAPVPPGSPPLAIHHGYGMVFGLLPVNVVHNLLHLGFGVWGVLAHRSAGAARTYTRTVGIVYGVLAILGSISATATGLGYVPLYGGDVWFHLALALPAAYVGFLVPARPRVAA